VAGAASAQPTDDAVEAGRRAYTSYCVRCHGINLVVTGSAFFDLRTFPKDDKERFVRSVNEGKRAMPAWKDIVKPEQIEAIWTYIGSVNGWGDIPTPK
jgi:mono/diheme cytochrome c family protein